MKLTAAGTVFVESIAVMAKYNPFAERAGMTKIAEQPLAKKALAEPHRRVIDQSQIVQSQIHQLTTALRQQMFKEIRETQNEKSINSCLSGGSPGETIA